jgi:hypothetical protein
MWLAAIDQGVSAVFMGDVLIAEPLIKERLGLTADLVGVLVLGRSIDAPGAQRRASDRVVWHD